MLESGQIYKRAIVQLSDLDVNFGTDWLCHWIMNCEIIMD